ncbi:hypothetical protein ASD02_31820 [Ensifer sp. Root1252]|nr:hypothetical protein ASD02_31820 [Ensifer sp. Root1252]KRC71099.1 hypothetical protein ASE32_33810 [Ensifer sp. Root231]KRC96131.1 hypothetical protein ASE47_32980 [Ensifer sp. Root258]
MAVMGQNLCFNHNKLMVTRLGRAPGIRGPARVAITVRELQLGMSDLWRTHAALCMAIALGRELQWTVLNQPSRITCAMPRASFLSIFTGIVVRLRCSGF